MKKIITQTAFTACAIFTIMMALFLAMGYLFAGPSYGLNITTSLYGVAIGSAVLQAFWFTGAVFKKLAYPARVACFGACLLPVIALCAWGGQWFPVDIPGTWVSFVVIYLVILAGMTAGYTVYYKKTAGGFDKALARYREQNRR